MKRYTIAEKQQGEMEVRWLSQKAQKGYNSTDELTVYAVDVDVATIDGLVIKIEKRFDVDYFGGITKGLTLDELEAFLEEICEDAYADEE